MTRPNERSIINLSVDQAVPFPSFVALADPRRQLFVGMQYRGLVIFSLELSHAEYVISVRKKLRSIYAHCLRCVPKLRVLKLADPRHQPP